MIALKNSFHSFSCC